MTFSEYRTRIVSCNFFH